MEINWDAPEFNYYEKSTGWFFASIIIAIFLIIFSLVQGNLMFLIFVVIAEILILYWARQIPDMIEYLLDERGLHTGRGLFLPYSLMAGFAIDADHPHDPFFELIIRPAKKFSPDIKILFPAERNEEFREALKTRLKEIDYEESVMERVIKILRF
ncbi:MAG: hypothetical protein COU09_02895 [Candidatus Harrisonbacteria bacterium CG10_big_fil_rev_8_21_14_0_10_44_23]|uniref:DUF5673 domain-containing protein n=1 Tax=Candidatus Harrisonbacteria bacterium CG10_big_fil_rev_8_21_14_0_10_44_23 TaxID=1974585 RepID=A0A2H0URD1_9BACT|nr:MAG: hypothetical protein COU09_02895 [Candidatus Harrisonbacteria bacterium CG10_big_fil_rev_8_21_14_0_10_44_23]